MEIILQHKSEAQSCDCIVQYGQGLKTGETACGANGAEAIFVGVGDAESETFEDGLFCGLKNVMAIAEQRGYAGVAIDIDSFVSDSSLTTYVLNAFLDCLTERCGAIPAFDRTIYLLYSAYQVEESHLQGAEDAIFAPVKVNENQSFGDHGDPLKKEFQNFLKDLPEQTSFRVYLLDLIDQRNFSKYSDVYKKCSVSKSTFSKIANFTLKDYKPSKSTVAAFAIGLELDIKEAQKLFHVAGYHLGSSEQMDQIVRFFIENKIYDVQEVNYCLDYFGLPILGEHSRDDCVRVTRT